MWACLQYLVHSMCVNVTEKMCSLSVFTVFTYKSGQKICLSVH